MPASPRRDWYVWSPHDKKYRDARVIFVDTEKSNWTWDPEANAYYWHRFFSHQPDLNYDNPAVQREMIDILHFWLDKGLDGFRCDAVPYLFERDGTSCENLPETHAFLKRMRAEARGPLPRIASCSPRPTSGPRTPAPTSGTATSSTWRFTSR